jgi:hypothetical protein
MFEYYCLKKSYNTFLSACYPISFSEYVEINPIIINIKYN